MEMLKLSEIVLSVKPDLYDLLTPQELNLPIVLRNGLESVNNEDIMEIIEASILFTKQNDALH